MMCAIQDCNIVEIGYTNRERRFQRNVYINYNKFTEFIKTLSSVDTYCSAYLYNTEKVEEAELYGNLYLDFDDPDNLNNAREDALHTLSFFKIVYQIPSDQIKIYFSGHKGFHLIIPGQILGIEPHRNLNGIFKTIAEQVKTFSVHKTVDLKIYDNKRLFRIPNSVNGKTGLYKILLTSEELYSLTEEEIKDLAKMPRDLALHINNVLNSVANNQYRQAVHNYEETEKAREKKKDFRYRKKLNIMPECIKNILENGAKEGSRNITIACLTSYYKNTGETFDSVLEKISEWNSRNVKPTPYRELQATVKSIFFGEKSYGCSTLQTITDCNKSECKLITKKSTNKPGRRKTYAINTGNIEFSK